MAALALAVVSAGLSNPSSTRLLADRLTAAAVDALKSRGDDATVEVIELREHARGLADNLVTGFPNQPLRRAVDTVTGADGLIAVTPIFSASYSGLFKTFFDVLDKESLVGKPVLLGATAGTARHSLALEHAVRPGPPPPAPPATRWLWSTPSARCSPTCGRSPCPRPSSPRPRTGPAPVAWTGRWPAASTAPPASWPTWSSAGRRAPVRWTRSTTRPPRSRSSSAATEAPSRAPPRACE